MQPRQCPPLTYRRILAKTMDILSTAKTPSLRTQTSVLPNSLSPVVAELSRYIDAYTQLLASGPPTSLSAADKVHAASLRAQIQQTDRLICEHLLEKITSYVQSTEKTYAELNARGEASAVLEAGFMRDDLVKLRRLVEVAGAMVKKKAIVKARNAKDASTGTTRKGRKRGRDRLEKKRAKAITNKRHGRGVIAISIDDSAQSRTATGLEEWLLNSWLLLPPRVERANDTSSSCPSQQEVKQHDMQDAATPIAATSRSHSARSIHTIYSLNEVNNIAWTVLAATGDVDEVVDEVDAGKIEGLNFELTSLLPTAKDLKEEHGEGSLAQAQDELVREAEMWWRTRDFFAAWKG
jgi:hypothetical protein